MPSPPKFQPALCGGAVMGILSALPFVNFANCCCVWMITGGIVAAWVMQQNHAAAVSVLDGMAVGLLAGLVGAFIWLIVSYPISLAMSPFLQALGQRILDNARDVPPEVQDALGRFGAGRAGMAIGFAMNLFLGMIFSTLGGMLGALLFRKSAAPPPVEPSDRWSGGPPSPLLPTDGSLPRKLTPPPDAPGGPPPVA